MARNRQRQTTKPSRDRQAGHRLLNVAVTALTPSTLVTQ